jgi:hypothetical protein
MFTIYIHPINRMGSIVPPFSLSLSLSLGFSFFLSLTEIQMVVDRTQNFTQPETMKKGTGSEREIKKIKKKNESLSESKKRI